jgi:hypothetical protein
MAEGNKRFAGDSETISPGFDGRFLEGKGDFPHGNPLPWGEWGPAALIALACAEASAPRLKAGNFHNEIVARGELAVGSPASREAAPEMNV